MGNNDSFGWWLVLAIVGVTMFFVGNNFGGDNNSLTGNAVLDDSVERVCVNSTVTEKVFVDCSKENKRIAVLELENNVLKLKDYGNSLRNDYCDNIKQVPFVDDLGTSYQIKNLGRSAEMSFNRQVWLVQPNGSLWVSCDSHSMTPTLDCSRKLIVYKPYASELRVGDIVQYSTNAYEEAEPGLFYVIVNPSTPLVIHRIVKIEGDMLTLKGDNNDWVDSVRVNKTFVQFKVWI